MTALAQTPDITAGTVPTRYVQIVLQPDGAAVVRPSYFDPATKRLQFLHSQTVILNPSDRPPSLVEICDTVRDALILLCARVR